MKKKDVKKSHGGFTLIEIIAVLVILGILAAVAIPRFANLQDQSRLSAAEGVASAYLSGISLAYAQAVVSGQSAAETAIDENCKVGDNLVATVTGPYVVKCSGVNLKGNVTVTVEYEGHTLTGNSTIGATGTGDLVVVWESPEKE